MENNLEKMEKIEQETDKELKEVLEKGNDEEIKKFIREELLKDDVVFKEGSEEEKQKALERYLQMFKKSN